MIARPLAAVVLILTALATVALPAPVSAQDDTATLTVHVTGAGGLPLAGADVAVTSAEADAVEAAEATTDATGNASFDLPTGIYTVTVTATGHETATEDTPLSEDTTLEVALEASDVTSPVATGDIVVEVLNDDTGEPVQDARVTIRFTDRDEKDSEETDDDGVARFEDRAYGRGEITVSKSGFEDVSEKFTLSSPEQRIEVDLEPASPAGDATVEITVLDHDGDPIEGADVQGNSWNGQTSGFDSAKTDEDGKATLHLPEGHGGVSVSHPEYYGNYASFDATDGDAEAEVVLAEKPKPDATLTGVVVDSEGAPVEGAQVWITVDYRWYEMRAAESEGAGVRAMPPYYCCPDPVTATTDEDGRFEAKVYAGDLNIQTTAKGYAGQNDRASVGTGDTEDIRIILEKVPPKDAVLRGRVVDIRTGVPVANAGVNLNNLAWSDYQYATTDKAGEFELRTYPGYVQVNVWPNYGPVCIMAEDTAAVDPVATEPAPASDAPESAPPEQASDNVTSAGGSSGSAGASTDMAYYGESDKSMIWPGPPCGVDDKPQPQYYSFVTQLVLDLGSNDLVAKLEEKPAPGTALVGYVLDEDDNGIPGAWVNVRNEDTGEWGNAQTDKDGSYRIMVRPGHFVIDANAEGHYPRSVALVVGDDDTVRHDIELVEGVTRWVPCDECYHPMAADGGYAMKSAYAEEDSSSGGSLPPSGAPGASMTESRDSAETAPNAPSPLAAGPKSGPGANSFVGGGGGLGPYKASQTTGATAGDNPAPGLGLVALLAAAALVAFVARRK